MNIPASASTPERVLLRLDWQVIRRLDGLLQGDYRSLFYGYGVDFADLREYQPEDDIRYIDWNVTARLNTPYVRQYVEDREITAWFLLDISPSVDFGASENHKRKKLIDFVSTMARLLTRHGNRVGAVFFGGRIERTIPAKSGRKQVLQLMHALMSYSEPPGAGFTDLSILLYGALNTIKRRSLIFLVSDFISSPGWERPLNLLNQRHEVLAVQLWHPYEKQLPDIGPVYLQDAETGEQMYLDTQDKKFQRRFAEAALRRQAELDAAFQHAGVDVLSLSTEDDLVRSIVRLAGMRRQRRK
ncbi:MAG: ATPase [Chloroflexi bacterium RBG_16_54_18]|nr:MAG: ATPase [Chloroflexi bacterium RBG_16_54_18]